MFFLGAMAMINLRKVRSAILGFVGIGFSCLTLFVFATAGMYLFYELRMHYLLYDTENDLAGRMHIVIRYISYLFASGLLASIYEYSRDKLLAVHVPKPALILGFDAIFYSSPADRRKLRAC